MRARIDKIVCTYFHEVWEKRVVIARLYINGGFRLQRLYFDTDEEVKSLREGAWIEC